MKRAYDDQKGADSAPPPPPSPFGQAAVLPLSQAARNYSDALDACQIADHELAGAREMLHRAAIANQQRTS